MDCITEEINSKKSTLKYSRTKTDTGGIVSMYEDV